LVVNIGFFFFLLLSSMHWDSIMFCHGWKSIVGDEDSAHVCQGVMKNWRQVPK